MAERTYMVFAGLHEEAKEGWIWLSPGHETLGDYVRVRNPATRKSVVCEQRLLDDNFRRYYNDHEHTFPLSDSGDLIVMNARFRQRLGGIPTRVPVRLDVRSASRWGRYITASWHHPHPAIRTSLQLGFLSVGLGFLSVLLTVLGLAGCGAAPIVSGAVGFVLRLVGTLVFRGPS